MKKKKSSKAIKCTEFFKVIAVTIVILVVMPVETIGDEVVVFNEGFEEYEEGYRVPMRGLEENWKLENGTLKEGELWGEIYLSFLTFIGFSTGGGDITITSEIARSGSKNARVHHDKYWSICEHWVTNFRHYYYDIGPYDNKKGIWESGAWFYLPSSVGKCPAALYVMVDNHDHRENGQVDVVAALYFGSGITTTTGSEKFELVIGTGDKLLAVATDVPVAYDEWFYLSTSINTVTNEWVEIEYSIPSLNYSLVIDTSGYSLSNKSADISDESADRLYAGAVTGHDWGRIRKAREYTFYIDDWQANFTPCE